MLHIHYNRNVLDKFINFASSYENDSKNYPAPSELTLQLSYRDVYLDFFKDKKQLILRMRSGMHLALKGNRLYVRSGDRILPVLQFSSVCYERIKGLIASGYMPYDAVVRWICAWKGKDDLEESAVILADIYFLREEH